MSWDTLKPEEKPFRIPQKLLLSAGPTNYSPRVIAALASVAVTTSCKELIEVMDDIKTLLKYVFQTTNEATLAIQNSGTGGLEAVLYNLIDPGEKILVAVGCLWGERVVEMALIRGIDVVRVDAKLGEIFSMAELENAITEHKPVLLFITHGESSAGIIQPLEKLGEICHKHNCLLAVDAIASLGGIPLYTDQWGIDAAVGAPQKAVSGPPGLAFLTFSPMAVQRMRKVKTPPPYYYNILSLCKVWNCFGEPRVYHYTYSPNLLYAAREALAEIKEEGLENVWERHRKTMERLWTGMEKIGLRNFITTPENRLLTVCSVCLPSEVNWKILLNYLEEKYKVVIGFGIGPTTNKVIRIGPMGYNARPEVVDYLLEILNDGMKHCQSDAGHTKQQQD